MSSVHLSPALYVSSVIWFLFRAGWQHLARCPTFPDLAHFLSGKRFAWTNLLRRIKGNPVFFALELLSVCSFVCFSFLHMSDFLLFLFLVSHLTSRTYTHVLHRLLPRPTYSFLNFFSRQSKWNIWQNVQLFLILHIFSCREIVLPGPIRCAASKAIQFSEIGITVCLFFCMFFVSSHVGFSSLLVSSESFNFSYIYSCIASVIASTDISFSNFLQQTV